MVADIFVRHGFYWASEAAQKRNPVVGSNKVRYKSFENQIVKDFNKKAYGTPLGHMITFTDAEANHFETLLRHEYDAEKPNVWKGAIEFFPLWLEMQNRGVITGLNPAIIFRAEEKVVESVMHKRNGRADIKEARAITRRRYDIMNDLAVEYALPFIMTDNLIAGDYRSLREVFWSSTANIEFQESIAYAVIDPAKWEVR